MPGPRPPLYFAICRVSAPIALPLCPHRPTVPSHLPSVDATRFLLIVAFFYNVLQPIKAVLYFNVLYFLSPHFSLPYGCETHPHTFRHSRAPSSVPPLAASLILWFIVAFFYWRPPNAWAPSPSLFSRCVAFRHPKQPPQREFNDIARARRRARCYELARRAGSGCRRPAAPIMRVFSLSNRHGRWYRMAHPLARFG